MNILFFWTYDLLFVHFLTNFINGFVFKLIIIVFHIISYMKYLSSLLQIKLDYNFSYLKFWNVKNRKNHQILTKMRLLTKSQRIKKCIKLWHFSYYYKCTKLLVPKYIASFSLSWLLVIKIWNYLPFFINGQFE